VLWLGSFARRPILMLFGVVDCKVIFRVLLKFIIFSPLMNSRKTLAFIGSVEEISYFSWERALAAKG
jgi:hypothetical protein